MTTNVYLEHADIRQEIINNSIILLKCQGLKFSVDTLASAMKISKKTIYKYFANKEELAIAIFENAFKTFNTELDEIVLEDIGISTIAQLLNILDNALFYTEDWIYNRYALNSSLKDYTNNELNKLWNRFQLILMKNYGDVVNEKCLRYVVFSSLTCFKNKPNREELLSSFTKLLFNFKQIV